MKRNFCIYICCTISCIFCYAQESDHILDSICSCLNNTTKNGNYELAISSGFDFTNSAQFQKLEKRDKGRLYEIIADIHIQKGEIEDYRFAINELTDAMDLYGKDNEDYYKCMHKLAYCYALYGDIEKSDKIANVSIKYSSALNTWDYCDKAAFYWSISQKLSMQGLFELAIIYAEQYFTLVESCGDADTVSYIDLAFDVSSYYDHSTDYEKEISVLKRIEPIVKKVYGEQSGEYINCICKIAVCYNFMHKYDEYEKWEEQLRKALVEIGAYEAVNIKEIPIYTNLSIQYSNAKDYVNAIKSEFIALNIACSHADSISMAKSYNVLSHYFYMDNDLNTAIKLCRNALKIYDSFKMQSLDRALAYNNMSVYCHSLNDDESAVEYGRQAKIFFEKQDVINDEHTKKLYSDIVRNVMIYSASAGKIDDIDKSVSAQIDKGINTNDIAELYNSALIFYSSKDFENMEAYFHKAFSLQKQELIEQSKHLTSKTDFEEYWKKNKYCLDKSPALSYTNNEAKLINADTYEAILINRSVMGEGRINEVTAEQLSNSINENSIAIEFFIIRNTNLGDAYAALLIKKEWDSPKCIKLFSDSDLNKIKYEGNVNALEVANSTDKSILYSDQRLGRILMKKILNKIGDVKDIYYVPNGILNKIDIEHIIIDDSGKDLSQQYNFHRLSSTSQLVTH